MRAGLHPAGYIVPLFIENSGKHQRKKPKNRYVGNVPVQIIAILAEIPRATVSRLAEDAGCSKTSAYDALRKLAPLGLVQMAGPVKTRAHGAGMPAMTWGLGPKLKKICPDTP